MPEARTALDLQQAVVAAVEKDLSAENRVLRKVNTELRLANDVLTQCNQDLQQFVYLAVHDLQEPLRSIITSAERIVRHENVDTGTLELLDQTKDSARRLRNLVNDLAQYALAGKQALQPRKAVELLPIARGAIGVLREAITQSGAHVTCADLPAVAGNASQLEAVFGNLLDNALKYRRPEIAPVVRIRAENEEAGLWRILVEDNGIGIPAVYQTSIFQPFKRLHGREVPGTGLGLALCSRVVEYHGGRMGVESVPGEGSSFWFTLPAVQDAEDE